MNICIIGFGEIGKKFFKILNLKNNTIYIVEKKKINLKFRNVLIFQDVSSLPREIFYDLIIICTSQITKIGIFKKISKDKQMEIYLFLTVLKIEFVSLVLMELLLLSLAMVLLGFLAMVCPLWNLL